MADKMWYTRERLSTLTTRGLLNILTGRAHFIGFHERRPFTGVGESANRFGLDEPDLEAVKLELLRRYEETP